MSFEQEQRQILQMLAEGKITAEDAARLLDKVRVAPDGESVESGGQSTASTADSRTSGSTDSRGSSSRAGSGAAKGHVQGANRSDFAIATVVQSGQGGGAAGAGKKQRLRYLRVVVEGKEQVNIRLPLDLVRAGLRLTTMMPEEARRKVESSGVDLAHLSDLEGDELIDALRELHIDIEADGYTVRIFCE